MSLIDDSRIDLIAAAEALVRRPGELSPDEAEMAGAEDLQPLAPEMRELALYSALVAAARARMRMDAMNEWNIEYAQHFREREIALDRARVHHQALLGCGHPIPADLAAMVERERGLV